MLSSFGSDKHKLCLSMFAVDQALTSLTDDCIELGLQTFIHSVPSRFTP